MKTDTINGSDRYKVDKVLFNDECNVKTTCNDYVGCYSH